MKKKAPFAKTFIRDFFALNPDRETELRMSPVMSIIMPIWFALSLIMCCCETQFSFTGELIYRAVCGVNFLSWVAAMVLINSRNKKDK